MRLLKTSNFQTLQPYHPERFQIKPDYFPTFANPFSFQLVEFYGHFPLTPKYAILSHTWERDEVSYSELLSPTKQTYDKMGFNKICASMVLAAARGYGWIWIDTCCIDKTSLPELSESINSMYQWYQDAGECYAYLADIDQSWEETFEASRWFRRGWTLQELIAPKKLVFFDQDWQYIGQRSDLTARIFQATKIPFEVLNTGNPQSASVAQRMSWASRRSTTRVEDTAYCLLGLFGCSMPLLYGEGERAFERLQEEIMRTSDDHSLFAWKFIDETDRTGRSIGSPGELDDPKDDSLLSEFMPIFRGLLARSPEEFADSWKVESVRNWEKSTPFSMTNAGICIELQLGKYDREDEVYYALLNCNDNRDDKAQPVYIFLKKLTSDGDQFVRVNQPKWDIKRDAFHRMRLRRTKDSGKLELKLPALHTEVLYVRQRVLVPPLLPFCKRRHRAVVVEVGASIGTGREQVYAVEPVSVVLYHHSVVESDEVPPKRLTVIKKGHDMAQLFATEKGGDWMPINKQADIVGVARVKSSTHRVGFSVVVGVSKEPQKLWVEIVDHQSGRVHRDPEQHLDDAEVRKPEHTKVEILGETGDFMTFPASLRSKKEDNIFRDKFKPNKQVFRSVDMRSELRGDMLVAVVVITLQEVVEYTDLIRRQDMFLYSDPR